ncbi:protein kinase domain-containing protein [[Actinomadura] parvosata]|uniref:protein kinase domain-containing protein n=1 Tax=[Actinomadura] parvosata TaxID=1955412 RepID=UPI00406CF4E9
MDGDRVIGGYTLRRLLGRGGMGEVYLAATPTGGLAAVKLIHPALAGDPAFRRRFEREVAAARRVARFCTAPVLDAGIDDGVAYLVTEYVKGPDLAQAVREQGPLSGGNLEALAVGVATALSAIHGAGVIHRDLKPGNVLLSPLGPRVIDFGIARLVGHDALSSQAILGTPAFMAPEQARGEPLTPAADVFSWGGVIAFAGTGRLPFGGESSEAALWRIAHEPPRLSGLDDGIRGVVERALAKDPLARPTASELLAELVGGTRLATATEVVERTWTGTVTADLRTPAAPSATAPAATPPAATPPAVAPPAVAPPAVAPPAVAPPAVAPPAVAPPAVAPPGAAAVAPLGAAPSVAPTASSGGAPLASPGLAPGVAPGGAAGEVALLASSGAAPATSPATPGAARVGTPSTPPAPPPGTDARAGRVGRGRSGGRRWRRWAWGVAGSGVLALGVLAVVTLPGRLTARTWPYEAAFADGWAVGASEGGSARTDGGAYELDVKPGWRLWKSAPVREPESGVVVSAKGTLEEGEGEYGVWCHGSASSGNRYEFGVSGAGKVSIVKRRTGTEGKILYGPADAPRTAANRIVAECGQSGSKVTLRMWLNETLVAEVSDADAPYGPGEAGVHAASSATRQARVRFESFAVRPATGT